MNGLIRPELLRVAQSFDPAGFFYDFKRPEIENPNGTFSTEETITELIDGRWVNFPSIWDGQRLPYEAALSRAIEEMKKGKVFPSFSTLDEAERQAELRSQWRGMLEQLGLPGIARK